jgi:uncharacterized protein
VDVILATGRVLVAGAAQGAVLRLTAPLSFWGGVNPKTGSIADPRHPQCGECVTGRILAFERTIGSSSGSSVLLELIAAGKAPSAILLTVPDAIVTLGAVVAEAMGYPTMPVCLITLDVLRRLPPGLTLDRSGNIRTAPR